MFFFDRYCQIFQAVFCAVGENAFNDNYINSNPINKPSQFFLILLFVFSQSGRSSLHVAAMLSHDATAKALIQAGADVNMRNEVSRP